jgi:hypothetical protein
MDYKVIWRRSCVGYTGRFWVIRPVRTMKRDEVIGTVSNLFAWYKTCLTTEHTTPLHRVSVPGQESHLLGRLFCPDFQN